MKSWFCNFSNFLEILILGCGMQVEFVSPELRHFVRSLGMKLEAVDSVNPVILLSGIVCVRLSPTD